ncbi:MAG: hypothetical protein D6760_03430 [Deltaproteobacteria bacterium]|nr:MAG: hypothetical protein D6760_03430 [Deltaproteobacteria bacterium]
MRGHGPHFWKGATLVPRGKCRFVRERSGPCSNAALRGSVTIWTLADKCVQRRTLFDSRLGRSWCSYWLG